MVSGAWPDGVEWGSDEVAAAYLGLLDRDPRRTMRALVKHHGLQCRDLGGERRYRKADLDRWLEDGGTRGRPIEPPKPRDPGPPKSKAA